jgi:hypothetical protein
LNIAFVSRCTTFYKYLSAGLGSRYPEIDFFHYEVLEDIKSADFKFFDHLIFKISELPKVNHSFKDLRIHHPEIITIGLVIDSSFQFNSKVYGKLDYIFIDKDIDGKLNEYFNSIFNPSATGQLKALDISKKARTYIQLNPSLSECMALNADKLTAKEIGMRLGKSNRTIEEYFIQLKKIFIAKDKNELRKIYTEICDQSPDLKKKGKH